MCSNTEVQFTPIFKQMYLRLHTCIRIILTASKEQKRTALTHHSAFQPQGYLCTPFCFDARQQNCENKYLAVNNIYRALPTPAMNTRDVLIRVIVQTSTPTGSPLALHTVAE